MPALLGQTQNYSIVIPDTGYTAICPDCSARFHCRAGLVGVSRELALEPCDKCGPKRGKYGAVNMRGERVKLRKRAP